MKGCVPRNISPVCPNCCETSVLSLDQSSLGGLLTSSQPSFSFLCLSWLTKPSTRPESWLWSPCQGGSELTFRQQNCPDLHWGWRHPSDWSTFPWQGRSWSCSAQHSSLTVWWRRCRKCGPAHTAGHDLRSNIAVNCNIPPLTDNLACCCPRRCPPLSSADHCLVVLLAQLWSPPP